MKTTMDESTPCPMALQAEVEHLYQAAEFLTKELSKTRTAMNEALEELYGAREHIVSLESALEGALSLLSD